MSLARRNWWKNSCPQKMGDGRKMIAKNHARPALGKFGPLHPGWKGGRLKDKRDGYIRIYAPNHPFKRKEQAGYVLEHRLVMEKTLGRYLRPEEDVNHINGKKDDNRPKNLRVVSHYAHYEKHGCPTSRFKFFTQLNN